MAIMSLSVCEDGRRNLDGMHTESGKNTSHQQGANTEEFEETEAWKFQDS